MKKSTIHLSLLVCLVFLFSALAPSPAESGRTSGRKGRTDKTRTALSSSISRDPYIGSIVVDEATGRVLASDQADAVGYPASVIKLMDLLLILEMVNQGTIKLSDRVTVTAEAAAIGGSQVYLKQQEIFSIDDLLYALMVKSANDAAVALAVHTAGSKEAFIQMMNQKARGLGMTSTRFHSVHGLPPGRNQSYDISTPRDLSLLARAVLSHPDTLRYTSARKRPLRNGTFIMNNHNHLLDDVDGCDGLKTGYFAKAGFSIIATAKRGGERIIAVVLGSRSSKTRDLRAKELIGRGFDLLQPTAPVVTGGESTPPVLSVPPDTGKTGN